MIKRTTGRLLLTLLVITGLAGTLNNSSLSPKERKQAINSIKNARKDFLASVQGLSHRQLQFRQSATDPSISELITSLAEKEKEFNERIKSTMQQSANPEARLKIALTDEQLLADKTHELLRKSLTATQIRPEEPSDALKKFNSLQAEHVKYIRTSTEDLRNHVVNTFAGWIDCYQYYLLMAEQNRCVAKMINDIRATSNFPVK